MGVSIGSKYDVTGRLDDRALWTKDVASFGQYIYPADRLDTDLR
jgi:hypothetical protein